MSITGGGLDPIVAELRSIRAAQSKLPRAVWATVTQQVPLRIIVDGDTQPMAGRPAQTSPAPAAGTRVLCLMQNGRATIIGNAPSPEAPESVTVAGTLAMGSSSDYPLNDLVSTSISFPEGRFTEPPVVIVSTQGTFGSCLVSHTDVTSEGFTAQFRRIYNQGFANGTLHWNATQMRAS